MLFSTIYLQRDEGTLTLTRQIVQVEYVRNYAADHFYDFNGLVATVVSYCLGFTKLFARVEACIENGRTNIFSPQPTVE